MRAGRRRRRALYVAALASLVAGAVTGSGHESAAPDGAAEVPMAHSRKPVPILMYHAVSTAPAGTGFPGLFVKPTVFRRQMAYLAKRGYHAATLDQVYGAWEQNGLVPEQPIVISFDDGYRGDYTDAMPILAEREWPGVLNLSMRNLENGELSEEMVREMLDAGWELASHSISHLDLTRMRGKALRREIAGSREALRERFGVPVDSFCYPAGRFDPKVVAEVRAAGYLTATTTVPGLASRAEPLKLRRVRVEGGDGVAGLAAKLEAAG